MTKIVLQRPTSGFSLAAINDNFDKIEAEFQNKVLYRENPVGENNQMNNHLDMNGFDLLNVQSLNGIDASEIGDISQSVADAAQFASDAEAAALTAQAAANDANSSAQAAADSANTAASYSSLGLGGGPATDLGLITDSVIIFPTDYGTVP